jgi:hypothetical protein
MEAIMGETLFSTSVEVLLEKLVSSEFVDSFQTTQLDVSILKKLKTTLMRLDMLRDAVFEADDLFDQINLFQYQTQTATAQVLKNISSLFKQFNGVINSKMQKIIQKLEGLSSGEQLGELSVSNETPTTSAVFDEPCIYGRERQ